MRFNVKQLISALFTASLLPAATCQVPGTGYHPQVCSTTQQLSDLMSDSNYVNFVNVLQNRGDNFLHILKSGDTGFGNLSSDVVDVRSELTPAARLRATQNEIGLDDSLLFILSPNKANPSIPDSSQYILEILQASPRTILRPMGQDIIIAGDDIIDGHHRWSTVALLNPSVKMGTLHIHGTKDPIEALKITHSAILATKGSLPTAGKRGTNMLTMPESDIFAYVSNNISKPVVTDLMRYWNLSSPEEAVDKLSNLIMRNLSIIKQHNVNRNYDISRTHMPQTDRQGNWLRALQSGKVNVRYPYGGGGRKRRSSKRRSRRRKSSRRMRSRRRTRR